MPQYINARPLISVRLYKTISRKTIDGQTAVSARYAGKDEFIDLLPMMGDGSVVRTSKSVREPAGGFSITFADKAQNSLGSLESVYGLVEPMDVVEIRMWGGVGARPQVLPIVMRGFVTMVRRSQSMGDDGKPYRSVEVSGQDYGKIWQMYQIIYLAAYASGQALLTNFGLWEMFGIEAVNTMKAADFVRAIVDKIINPYLKELMPENTPMPRELTLGDGITVAHGTLNNSVQQTQGSLYDAMKYHGDVGTWNELYTEDREDGVHVVYRPVPALHLNAPEGATTRLIQADAPEPVYCEVLDSHITQMSMQRSDANVANFYWVNNERFDLISDEQRKLASIPANDKTVYPKDYPNAAVKYYGTRAMYSATNQGEDSIKVMTGGLDANGHETRSEKMLSWIEYRRRCLVDMNKDNVVFESGQMVVKGGLLRPSGDLIRAGDYARVTIGQTQSDAYIVQIDHTFVPLSGGYTTALTLERGEGFARRVVSPNVSPWLAEQATRFDGGLS